MNGFAFTPSAGFTPEDSPNIRWGATSEGDAIMGDTGSDDIFSFQKYTLRFDFTVLHRRPPGFTNDPAFQNVADADHYQHAPDQRFMGGYYFGPTHQTAPHGAQFAPTTGLLAEEEKMLDDILRVSAAIQAFPELSQTSDSD